MRGSEIRTVVLGVTGCIAAYKACEVARALVKDGVRVKVVMTDAATRFVGPATFRTLTGEPVVTSLWEDPGATAVHHISLAQEADVFVIAPATANTIAKLAAGRADDILTTSALATEATLVVAPAMNTHMWRKKVTQRNLEILRGSGARIVTPEVGELACGEIGEGRLADVADIVQAVRGELHRVRDFEGRSVVVTAGPTREAVDAVRFLSNPSSGKTGYAIAEEFARRGADVTLVSGPTTLPDPFDVRTLRVTTAQEMFEAVGEVVRGADVFVGSAAVSDFRPTHPAANKIKKSEAQLSIALERTNDILAWVGESAHVRVVVGFAAETDDVISHASSKRESKGADLIVANDVGRVGLGFGSDRNSVMFVSADGVEDVPEMPKSVLATTLVDRIAQMLERVSG